jgi:hypothetical protein
MTSPGLPDWDPADVPVDETAEPPDAEIGCTFGVQVTDGGAPTLSGDPG